MMKAHCAGNARDARWLLWLEHCCWRIRFLLLQDYCPTFKETFSHQV